MVKRLVGAMAYQLMWWKILHNLPTGSGDVSGEDSSVIRWLSKQLSVKL
jgi:hypothetical protein